MTIPIDMPAAPPRPAPGAPRPYHFPSTERFTLPNGLRVLVAPVTKLPLVTVLAVIDAGAAADPAGQEGVAQLTASLLTEGAGSLDGAALADVLETMGTALDAHADWDVAVARLTTLAPRLTDALGMLGMVLRTPRFPADEFARLRDERLASLLQQRSEPRSLASEAFDQRIFDAAARYASPDGGSVRSVQGLTEDAVRAFHAARYTPAATTLIVSGDVTVDQVHDLVVRTFGDWQGAAPAAIAAPDTPSASGRAVTIVAKPGAPQTELRVGHAGPTRATPDYFALLLGNAVLGGLFGSRLNLNLREKHGYTYGAHSGFDWRRHRAPFVMDAAVQSEVTGAAVTEMLAEFAAIRESLVTDAELTLARDYLDGVFPIRFETTRAIAGALSSLVTYGLPSDYFDTYRANVRAVSAESIRSAMAAHLDPARLQVVAVGDPDVIREQLAVLGHGEVTVLEPEQVLGGGEGDA
jgi:zinc protease